MSRSTMVRAGKAALLSLGLLVAGCGAGSHSSPRASEPSPSPVVTAPSTAGSGTTAPATAPTITALPLEFHASDFPKRTATGANQWLPLIPGRQAIRNGNVNIGHRTLTHRRVFTVTDAFKTISGVRAVLVIDQDFNAGELAEQALDYLAEDRAGNVWYLGSYTEAYEGGRFVNATDGWLNGNQGARGGILMPANPTLGLSYDQAKAPGGAGDAKVVKGGQSTCVPYRCFRDVLVIEEGASGDEPEFKYYAPGVGHIMTEPRYSGGEQEIEQLVNVINLSPRGLAEMSDEVVKMDKHAGSVFPRVFGRSAPATRVQ